MKKTNFTSHGNIYFAFSSLEMQRRDKQTKVKYNVFTASEKDSQTFKRGSIFFSKNNS